VQLAHAASWLESRRHWKPAIPEPAPSSPLNLSSAELVATRLAGLWVIAVWGAVVSTVQVASAGVWSVLPAWSIARTSNL
jgi:hypothetical protein